MIHYEDLIEGSRWLDPDGREWVLYRRGPRAHSNTFARPDLAGLEWPAIGHGPSGDRYRYATEQRMNLDGWRRA